MKRKQVLNTIMTTILGGLLFSACQKSDIAAVNTADQQTEEKFFNSHIAAKPATRAVQEYIRRENSRRPVVKGLLQKAGIPRWDKALIFENVELPSGRGAAQGDSTTILHIPFVPENGNMVRGSLMVKMEPGDTTMNLVSADDYASYGFGNATANAWNARDVFNILTRLDYEVFGRTKYIVNDGRIVGDSQHIKHRVTIDQTAQQTLNDLFVTLAVTNSQTVCIIAGEPGSGPGVCNTYFFTTYYYIEIPDGGSGGGSGGGTGGGPTGGGGGGTGSGGTGWIPIEETLEEVSESLLGYATSEPESIVLSSESGLTREKFYNWVIYKHIWGMYKYVSHEKGVHVKVGNEWKWQSLTHIDISRSGIAVGATLSCTLISATPTVGIYNAGMAINYNIEVSAVYRGSPLSYSQTFLSQRFFNVND